MKTAIVSGAAGFVGYHLINKLYEEGIQVIALCRPNSEHNTRLDEFEGIITIECDSSELLTHADMLKKYSPDIFYNFSWNGTTGIKRTDYSIQLTNVKNTCDAYICAADIGCTKFVSSGTVYENLAKQILDLDNFNPSSYYIMAAHFAYESILQLSKKYNLDFTWCQFCQPIGRFQKSEQLMYYLVNELKHERIPTFGKAENPFDMIVVEDLAGALYLIGNSKMNHKRYYIGSGHPKQLKEYLNTACKIIKPNASLTFGSRPDDGLMFSEKWLDSSPFMEETGFTNRHSFEEGIRNLSDWIDEDNKK